MYQALVSALGDAASWLQSASQSVPISQLSFMVWAMFIVSGRFDARNVFNASEQSTDPLSKVSFQKAKGEYLVR